MRLSIETFDLNIIERTLCVEALNTAGTIVDAAALLGLTRHALKRRITKHRIEWPVRRAIVHGDAQPMRSEPAPIAAMASF